MKKQPLFPLGQLFASPRALSELSRCAGKPALFLNRHRTGDWGHLPDEDRAINDLAVHSGGRIFSEYSYRGFTWWVITDGDRSRTTLLLPEEWFETPVEMDDPC